MSLASKVTFSLCCLASVGIITYVHLKQQIDRERMKQGVIRDVQQQQMRKLQNVFALEQQKTLTDQYKAKES